MKSFLNSVAQDILRKYGSNLADIAVVFPNKRASLFLNEALYHIAGHPVWSPAYITISDLFRHHSQLQKADDIKLISDLYRSYCSMTGSSETLDRFYAWGQLLLSDFDDVDKNMADADKVFANISNIHELDDASYLTDAQREVLSRFFGNLADNEDSRLKQKFLSFWSNLDAIYHDYNERLESQGLAYEGQLYRNVVNQENIEFNHKLYLFVGFNMMQKVELRLAERLMKDGKARFYWDFDDYYMANDCEAGHYIRLYLQHFPNELDNHDEDIYSNMRREKHITFMSATTEDIQARYAGEWLLNNNRISDGRLSAVIMADEKLLPTVIHSLPPEVENLNVTTGFPLAQTPFFSLVALLIKLQTEGLRSEQKAFRLRNVLMILRHPYAHFISPKVQELKDLLLSRKIYYPSIKLLAMDEELELLFKDLSCGQQELTTGNYLHSITQWLLDVLTIIARGVKEEGSVAKDLDEGQQQLMQEALFRTFTLLTRVKLLIESGDLDVDVTTFQRLISQIIQSTSIPFHGEPAVGTQVMGVLETRNLDFKHVLILSCNEGNLPKGINDSSFIPYAIRRAYGLTTIDNKVAIYAYYFYSILQRAEDITILYNSSTEGGKQGEMSRFMLQMQVESGKHIHLAELHAAQNPVALTIEPIEKSPRVMEEMESVKSWSPTALNTYIYCQKQFYYRFVCHIAEPDDNEEDEVDNIAFGNIFHHSAQEIYLRLAPQDALQYNEEKDEWKVIHPYIVSADDIERFTKDPRHLEEIVEKAFDEELFYNSKLPYASHGDLRFKIQNSKLAGQSSKLNVQSSKSNAQSSKVKYNGLQLINRQVIIDYLKRMLKADKARAPFTIMGLEHYVSGSFTTKDGREVTVGGIIDRWDASADGSKQRIVDYKTGRPITKTTDNLDQIFAGEDYSKRHTNYFLQSMLYSILAKGIQSSMAFSPALLFIQQASKEDYDPTIVINKEKVTDIAPYEKDFREHLQQLLTEIFDASQPLHPTAESERCEFCPYKELCSSPKI